MNQKIILALVACIAVQCIPTASGQREGETDLDTNASVDLSALFPFVSLIKSQVKQIIYELALQIFEYVRAIAQDCKVRFLKKLGKYTMSDVFHFIFDGVTEFVKDEPSETTEKSKVTESSEAETTTKNIVVEDELVDKENLSEENVLDNTYPWTLYN